MFGVKSTYKSQQKQGITSKQETETFTGEKITLFIEHRGLEFKGSLLLQVFRGNLESLLINILSSIMEANLISPGVINQLS